MSGGLYSVLGKSQFRAFATCPEELLGQTLTIASSDGESFAVEAEAACASARIKEMALASDDKTIKVPLTKAVLSKVIEFIKYHKDTPVGHVQVPLKSDNLADCGMQKWDVAFLNMDKEILFEVMHAAKWLDVPSLILLTGAKAAVLVKDKAVEKLRKDFGFTNDLPSEEEEELTEMWCEYQKNHKIKENEAGLFEAAVIMQGVYATAEKSGVYTETSSIKPKSWRQACWRVALLQDWKKIAKAPLEIRGDRDIAFDAIEQSHGNALKDLDGTLKQDKDLVLQAVALNGASFKNAADSLKSDRDFVRKAVALDGTALVSASADIQADRGFILEVIKDGKGSAVKGATKALKADQNFILECVAVSPEAFKYAADELREDRQFVLQVVQKNGEALQYALQKFKSDNAIVDAAVATNPSAIVHAHTALRVGYNADLLQDSEVQHKKEKALQDSCGVGATKQKFTGSILAAGVPLTQEGGGVYTAKLQKSVHFSAMSTMTANMGQANYIASNSWLDKIQFYDRPEIDAVTLMWGAVGNIGMRWKAFASADFLNATPDALLSIMDASKVLHLTTTRMDPPEWYSASFFDEYSRQGFLAPTAGGGTGGGYMGNEDMGLVQTGKSSTKPEDEETLKSVAMKIEGSNVPLGGWPVLAKIPTELAAMNELELVEGARVQLIGLKHNNMFGTAIKKCLESKWKVRLENNKGIALLREGNLRVVAHP